MKKIYLFFGNNQQFTIIIAVLIALAGLVTGQPGIAMWFGFAVAGFSVVSNDSIQTLGTFLSSNRKVAWHWLWLFIGGIMLVTVTYSWISYSGDVSYGRLNEIPQPQNLQFIQLLAPIVLIVLTRFKMPVSTTFLILATFSSTSTIQGMVNKTLIGYFLAFSISLLVWGAIGFIVHKLKRRFKREMTKATSADGGFCSGYQLGSYGRRGWRKTMLMQLCSCQGRSVLCNSLVYWHLCLRCLGLFSTSVVAQSRLLLPKKQMLFM